MTPLSLRDETLAKLRDVWTSLTDLTAGLDAADWDRPTDCPGWTVRDQLAHLLSFEWRLAGRPSTLEELSEVPPYVHNDIGKANERAVRKWRKVSADRLVAAWREIVDERLAQIAAYTEADLTADSWTPLGPGTVLDLLQIRILDHWIHEQDIRRAVGRPGDESGPVAEHTIDRMLAGVPMIVGKRASAPEGASVVIELTGPVSRERAVTVRDGRAKPSDRPADPTAAIYLDSTTYAELAAGRTDPEAAITEGRVTWTGDDALARKIATSLNIMP